MDEQVVLQQAIAAARAGRKSEARQLLEQILQANPYHEQAWLWMSAVAETDAERVRCLQRVLVINPDNAAARKGLAQLQARIGATPVTAQPDISSLMAQCPHCGATNRAGARFCSGCGQSLEQAKPSSQAQTVRCPGCGFDNPAGAQFCGKCGHRLGVVVGSSPPPPSSSQRDYPQPKAQPGIKSAKSKRGLWTAAAVLGVLMVCVIGGWLVSLGVQSMTGPQSSPEALAEAAIITFYSEGNAGKVIAWYSPDYREDASQRIRQSVNLGGYPGMWITDVVVRPRGSKGWMQANVLCADGEETYDFPVIVENLSGKWYIVSINYRY